MRATLGWDKHKLELINAEVVLEFRNELPMAHTHIGMKSSH